MAKRKRNKSSSFTKKFQKYFFLVSGLALLISSLYFAVNNLNSPCANSISCINDLSGKYEDAKFGHFMGKSVNIPSEIAQLPDYEEVLGESNDKHIYIDLTNQKLYAKEGDRTVYEFLISSGKWGRTPTGDFMTWIKLRYTRMTGGNKAIGTFYDLPNVPYTMYFYNSEYPKYRGYGIHGAYWHNNFGHPMSHGCINMKPEEAGLLYAWSNPLSISFTTYAEDKNQGTPITIYGQAPWD